MNPYLGSNNFPSDSARLRQALDSKLSTLLQADYRGDFYTLFAAYQRILADNRRCAEWPALHDKLQTLFMCGRAVPLDGPMVGIPLCIRDSDFFRKLAVGHDRSVAASLEILANTWNATFADSGLWMGKTFEPVSRTAVSQKCDHDPAVMAAYDEKITRLGRNFFREPAAPNLFQTLGLPAITQAWKLKDRPSNIHTGGFDGILLQQNLDKEKVIPYNKTGGYYLADMGKSVIPEMQGKTVYALNYRWTNLHPYFPMSCLVDELVQIADGIYLGQLIYATRHFSFGMLDLPFTSHALDLGESYAPHPSNPDYGYQNNGYFLMMDPAYAERIYAAFPQLGPHAGGHGSGVENKNLNNQLDKKYPNSWHDAPALRQKFTTLFSSSKEVPALLHEGESVLQMLQRISGGISAQTNTDDQLRHFESLHQLFRAGVAPGVKHGLFQSTGTKGYNWRIEGHLGRDWYGETEVSRGFDYYHGATLNLHCGFADNFKPDLNLSGMLPGLLARQLSDIDFTTPNLLNMAWHNIGKYIFPWAGKSFETISPRKLSMLLDESANLALRYPERVSELKSHPASLPHYLAVKTDAEHPRSGRYAAHLSHSWDMGMSEEDKEFWQKEADERWLMGYNLQDKRILTADALMQLADMNYRVPDAALQQASESSGSPFSRQGYAFLGVADQDSILPLNQGKKVFQFHYRYPMIGGPAPIGYCLDELVEIADGLFLGQLIYATALHLPFNSSVDPADYHYQLFGYFLLLDDDWERHRQAIGLDTL